MPNLAMTRAADLHFAYQHGQEVANGDLTAEPEFKVLFEGDEEANREFQRGFAEETARLRQAREAQES